MLLMVCVWRPAGMLLLVGCRRGGRHPDVCHRANPCGAAVGAPAGTYELTARQLMV